VTAAVAVPTRHAHRSPERLTVGLVAGALLLPLTIVLSLALGAAPVSPLTVFAALTAYDGSNDHLIVQTIRLPRALIAATVGAALAVAGTVMQGLTRNPLASPGVLGINAGAGLAVVVAVFLLKTPSLVVYAWAAFLGAALSAALVYALSSLTRTGPTPLALTVAGAALSAVLSSLTTVVLVLNQRTLDEIRFWLAGSVAGRDIGLYFEALPYLAVGLGLALLLGRQLTTLALGEDVARGLGQRTRYVQIAAGVSVVLLAGASVAVAGPIGFVGLVVPHIARMLVGTDYRWLLPYAAICGAILLLLADVAARLVIRPQELPVGVMTALIGGPCFIYLALARVTR
jgi:iron complex transport system permease protein